MTATVINMAEWRGNRERAAARRTAADGLARSKRPTLDQVTGFTSYPNGGAA